jgi:hypothetical protein
MSLGIRINLVRGWCWSVMALESQSEKSLRGAEMSAGRGVGAGGSAGGEAGVEWRLELVKKGPELALMLEWGLELV